MNTTQKKPPLKGACLISQSGGPSSVINASVYGVIKAATESENITRVLGAGHGVVGILRDEIFDLTFEDDSEIELLKTTPSSALGSCRYKMKKHTEDDTDYKKILDILKKYDIRYYFCIGGNDSMDTCHKLEDYLDSVDYECRVVGIPKTIDNDLYGTDHTPGYGSAAKYVASTFMEVYLDSVVYDKGSVVIVEIMGRNAGWLTAASALAADKGCGPDLIYLPEVPFDMDDFLDNVERIYNDNLNVLVAISEGVKDARGVYIAEYGSDLAETKDAFGHSQMGGLAATLSHYVKDRLGNIKIRPIELSLLQRCAAHMQSKTDVDEAVMVGRTAVESALVGYSGCMVAMKRSEEEPYKIHTDLISLEDVANFEQKVPLEWITKEGNNIKEEFIKYASPLVEGETAVPRENGLPRFARLKKVQAK